MIKDKKLFSNFLWNTIGSGLASFNSLFFMMAITRINGLEDAGIFSITFATASIFYIFAIYSGRYFHTTDVKGNIKDKDYIVSRIITCLTTLLIVCIFVFINDYVIYKNIILILLCTWRGQEAFSDVFYAVLQKNGSLDKVGKSLVFKGILGILFFVIIDLFTKNLIWSCLAINIVSVLVLVCYDIPQALKHIKKEEKITKNNIKEIYIKEFYIFANSCLMMYILNAPKFAIESYLTEDIQAIFGIILMPASILPLFAQFVVAPIINKLKELYKDKNLAKLVATQNKMILAIIAFGIFAVFIGFIIGIPVLEILYNTGLDEYKIPFLIILIAYILYAIGYVKTMVLTIFRKIKEQFFVHIISAVVIFLASYILVKLYGINGAAISYFVTMLIYYLQLYMITKINVSTNNMLK